MNRIEPLGPGKPGFDVSSSPTPIQDQALRLLTAKVPMRQPPSQSGVSSRRTTGFQKICRTFKELFKITSMNFRLGSQRALQLTLPKVFWRQCVANLSHDLHQHSIAIVAVDPDILVEI